MSSLWQVPHVSRQDYSLLDISDDGFVRLIRSCNTRHAAVNSHRMLSLLQVSLMDDAGNTKDDLKLPPEEELAAQIKSGFDEGKELVVTVLKSMGEEMLCAVKVA
jgi:translation initiation factor 5A